MFLLLYIKEKQFLIRDAERKIKPQYQATSSFMKNNLTDSMQEHPLFPKLCTQGPWITESLVNSQLSLLVQKSLCYWKEIFLLAQSVECLLFNWMLCQNSEGVSISKNCLWFYKMSIENNLVRNAVVIAIIPRLWEMTQKGANLCTKWSERHFLDWKTCSVKWWSTISLSKI